MSNSINQLILFYIFAGRKAALDKIDVTVDTMFTSFSSHLGDKVMLRVTMLKCIVNFLFQYAYRITFKIHPTVPQLTVQGPVSYDVTIDVTIQRYRNSQAKIEDSKMHILRCMDSKFCVKFQRCPLKFHTKFLTHTPQNMHFTRC